MSAVRTVYVPWFSSQLDSSQKEEPNVDQTTNQTEAIRHGQERGNKRCKGRGVKSRSILKVKLPKLNKKVTTEDETPRKWMSEPILNKSKTMESTRGGRVQCPGIDSNSVGGDVFFFSQSPTSKAVNEKEKAKLAVLRAISKVLEENQVIRQRLAAFSQAN